MLGIHRLRSDVGGNMDAVLMAVRSSANMVFDVTYYFCQNLNEKKSTVW